MQISTSPRFHIQPLLDDSRIGRLHILIIVLCGVCMVLDGFDVQAMGYVAPALLQSWGIDKAALGPVFGAGLFGLLVGSLAFSGLADRLGRRPVLIASTTLFGLCMLLTPMVGTVQALVAMRFVTGLGLGAVMPNAMALTGEFSPARRRVSIMMLISCGFTVGAMLGGVLAAALIPRWGWDSVFYVGGAIPLAVAVLMALYLPESIQFLVLKGTSNTRIAALVRRIDPQARISVHTQFVTSEASRGGAPVTQLFHEGRALGTVLIWSVSFLNLIALYFLSKWLPTLAKLAGLSIEVAVMVGATLQLGGTLGTILMGTWIDRRGFRPVLVPCFCVAAVAIALIGHTTASVALLFATVFVTGFAVVGGQPAINAMAANFYPTQLRTTGVGWCLGIGRIGSVLGPVVGGELIRLEWTQASLFHIVAVPSVVIALILILNARRMPQLSVAAPQAAH
jgi:AAHS family 4-hydroxybenzoate transporter-like MFS transporter